MTMPVEFTTARLKLRQWREDDVEPSWGSMPIPCRPQVFGAEVERHDVWRRIATFLGHWQLRGFGLWALEERQSGDFVGYSGLWYPSEFADVEVGWGLVARHRGKGYAQEAAWRALRYGYGEIGLERLVSYVKPDNPDFDPGSRSPRRHTGRGVPAPRQAAHRLSAPETRGETGNSSKENHEWL